MLSYTDVMVPSDHDLGCSSLKNNNLSVWLLAQFCVAFSLLLMVPARADFAAGIEAYKQKDYQRAVDEWLPYAAENDSRALFNLGQMYRLGLGVDKDINVSEQYYRRAAKQGHAGARGNLGSILFSANPPQIDEALYYWRAAAREGDVRSQFLLGVQYFNGEHVNRDYVMAYAWINLAAEAGLDEAKNALNVLTKYLGPDDIAEGVRLSETFMTEPEPGPEPAIAQADPTPPSAAQAPETTVPEPMPEAAPASVPKPEVAATIEPTPAPEPAAEPTPSSVNLADDQYRVQIAALRSEADAQDYWRRASGRRADLTAGITHYVIQADLGDKGIYYRLQLGHFADRAAAIAYCNQLKATELSCFIVPSP